MFSNLWLSLPPPTPPPPETLLEWNVLQTNTPRTLFNPSSPFFGLSLMNNIFLSLWTFRFFFGGEKRSVAYYDTQESGTLTYLDITRQQMRQVYSRSLKKMAILIADDNKVLADRRRFRNIERDQIAYLRAPFLSTVT
jgi:hypothetical protein